jgi:hypothetical protein
MGVPHDDRAPLVRRTRRDRPTAKRFARRRRGRGRRAAPLRHLGQTLGVATKIATISAKALSGSASPARCGPAEFAGFAASNTWRRSARPPPAGWAGRPSPLRPRPRDTAVRVRSDRSYYPSPLPLAPRTSADHPLAFSDQKLSLSHMVLIAYRIPVYRYSMPTEHTGPRFYLVSTKT